MGNHRVYNPSMRQETRPTIRVSRETYGRLVEIKGTASYDCTVSLLLDLAMGTVAIPGRRTDKKFKQHMARLGKGDHHA